MTTRSNTFRLPFFAISILIAVSLAYIQFNAWGEVHASATMVAIETCNDTEGDDFVIDAPAKSEGILPVFFAYPGQQLYHSFIDSAVIPSQLFSPWEEIFILRC